MDSLAKYKSDYKNHLGNFLFSKIDLKFAYSQIPLHPEIRKHLNFNILGGKSTGTYQFINGFYGLSNMPTTFQKNARQNPRKHSQQIQYSRRHTNYNQGFT